MTKRQIYDNIVKLTTEIKATNVGLKLFEAARLSGQKVKEVAETFMREYPGLYKRMYDFAYEYNKLVADDCLSDVEIFGVEENEENGIFVLNPNVIDAPSYFSLIFLTNIDEAYLYYQPTSCLSEDTTEEEWIHADDAYYDALVKETGCEDLVEFLGAAFFDEDELEWLAYRGYDYENIYDLLADVFAGKLKEYVN